MFKLKVNDTFDWPVKFQFPENGKHKTQTFEATFRRLPREEMQDLAPVEGETTQDATDRLGRFLEKALVSIALEVVDQNDNPITDPAIKKAMAIGDQAVSAAMLMAFVEGITGQQRKN